MAYLCESGFGRLRCVSQVKFIAKSRETKVAIRWIGDGSIPPPIQERLNNV